MDVERLITGLGRRQFGVVERIQLLRGGMTATAIDRLLRAGRLLPSHPGVYLVAGAPDVWEGRVLGACLAAGPGAVASHRSAGRVWGLHESDVVEITVPRRQGPRLAKVVVHRALDLPAAHLTARGGLPVTNPLLTLTNLGAVLSGDEVADALERGAIARLYSIPAVDAVLDQVAKRGRDGSGVLRRVLDERALGTDRPDGMLEPRFARVCREQAVPPFRFQHVVRLPDGRFVARVDFARPELCFAVEVDGYAAHGSAQAMELDFERQARLQALGWTVLRFTWHQVVRRPAWVASTILAVLATLTGS